MAPRRHRSEDGHAPTTTAVLAWTSAQLRAATIIRLDDARQAVAFGGDPDAFLRASPCPVLVDEWQQVPASLGAVKRIVDQRHDPGQFLLTGSIRSRLMPDGWPGTGRIVPVRQWGLTQAEVSGRPDLTLDWLWDTQALVPGLTPDAPSVLDYLGWALAGGFPEARTLTPRLRSAWYEGYVDHLIHRDVAPLADVRTPLGLSRLLTAVAVNSAGLPAVAALAEAAHLDQRTAASYVDTLEDMRVIQRVQPWFRHEMTQLVKTPKYYVTDPGLAAHLGHVDQTVATRDGDKLGRLIDTFVAAQIRPLADLALPRIDLCHLRDRSGRHEVDLVLDGHSRGIVGVEVKAGAAVTPHDARHLAWLRDHVPDRFAGGYVLHTGPATHPLGERLWAVPIAALWRPEASTGQA